MVLESICVRIPKPLALHLRAYANLCDVSVAEVVRQSLYKTLALNYLVERPGRDNLPGDVRSGESLPD